MPEAILKGIIAAFCASFPFLGQDSSSLTRSCEGGCVGFAFAGALPVLSSPPVGLILSV